MDTESLEKKFKGYTDAGACSHDITATQVVDEHECDVEIEEYLQLE